MAHEKLTSKTINHIIRQGHGHKIDPDVLRPGHQLVMAAKGVEYHPALTKAKTLDHDAKFIIAVHSPELHSDLKKNHALDADTKKVLTGKKPNMAGYRPERTDDKLTKRWQDVKRRYFETKSAIDNGEY